MSNLQVIYQRTAWCTALTLALNSCGNAPVAEERKGSQTTSVTVSRNNATAKTASGTKEATQQNATRQNNDTMIDSPPADVPTSLVTSMEDRQVSGTPVCVMNVQYKGVAEQPATFPGAYCKDTIARFVNYAELSDLGYAAYLSVDEEEALKRADDGKSLLVTASGGKSGTLAILFPLNEVDIITKVVLSK